MLTITYHSKLFYINIDLIKKQIRKTILNILKVIAFICGLGGAMLIIGAVGSGELNDITCMQMLTRMIMGALLCGTSYIIYFIKNALQ